MHKIANEYPDAEISFDFYDDLTTILKTSNDGIKGYSYAYPHNITPRLYSYPVYDGIRSLSYSPTKGTRTIDSNYKQTVKELSKNRMYEHSVDEDDIPKVIKITKTNHQFFKSTNNTELSSSVITSTQTPEQSERSPTTSPQTHSENPSSYAPHDDETLVTGGSSIGSCGLF